MNVLCLKRFIRIQTDQKMMPLYAWKFEIALENKSKEIFPIDTLNALNWNVKSKTACERRQTDDGDASETSLLT